LGRRGDAVRARVLVRAQNLANNLITMDSGQVIDFNRTRLEQAHLRLEGVRHDYVGADLRDVDLTGLDLRGVRWSDATWWRAKWEEPIRAGSVQLGAGMYEFRPGGTHYPPSPPTPEPAVAAQYAERAGWMVLAPQVGAVLVQRSIPDRRQVL